RGRRVSRGSAQAVGPPDRGGVEDDIVFRAWIESGCVFTFDASVRHTAAGDHLQAGDLRGRSHPLPSDEAGDTVAVAVHAPGDVVPPAHPTVRSYYRLFGMPGGSARRPRA